MTIKELIVNIRVKNIRGEVDQAVTAIHFDSRKVVPGSVFVAVKGRATDGHMFIDKAVDRGAVCVITEEKVDHISEHVCVLTVENSAEVLAKIAGAFYDHPSRNLTMVGVTGTNGKTTVATLLFRLFTELGYKCGLLSTIENRIGDEVEPTGYTTPDAVAVQETLARMIEAA